MEKAGSSTTMDLGTVGSTPILDCLTAPRAGSNSGSNKAPGSKGDKAGSAGGKSGDTIIVIVTADGRICKICGCKDSTADAVNPSICIKWSRPPKYLKDRTPRSKGI